jgi:SecD/SecF fusion protein
VEGVAPFDDDTMSGTFAELHFGSEKDDVTAVSHDMVDTRLVAALKAEEHIGIVPIIENPAHKPGSSQRFNIWDVKLGLPPEQAQAVFDKMRSTVNSQPIFPLANKIGPRVADRMKETAIYAILVSLIGIIGYIWLRFQKVSYGLAAVVAIVHDVLIALGFIAISAYIANGAEGLALLLKIDSFQISLTIVAAFLTIIGYSLNDTIVIFDRIRELRGKSPRLDTEMINTSINQTLSRTLLTSLTTLIVVAILYWAGGPGLHGFAFTLLVGIIAGTYSTVFIACPVLLWLSRFEGAAPARGRSGNTTG